MINNPEAHLDDDHTNFETQGWSAYIASLDAFRKDLKQIHLLEEELSRVKRDREILVTRLIKTTKSRPTKSDLSAIASGYRSETVHSSRVSLSSVGSNVSSASKEGKRAGKLAEAQAELLGCEEHLRGLEVRIEHERNKVMMRGLEDRFRAMEAVGRMWVGQAQRGLEDLEKASGASILLSVPIPRLITELPPDAYELDSNPSLAPSQSASQIAYEDSAHRGHVPFPKMGHPLRGPGSIAGSIVEEEEGSSDDENQGNLVVHENRPGSRVSAVHNASPTAPKKPSPLGVPSVVSRGQSSAFSPNGLNSDLGTSNYRSGGRRAASDIGLPAYRSPTARHPLRRTFSDDNDGRAGSDRSSVRSFSPRKKKGFFASIGRFFKGSGKSRSGRSSPPYGSGTTKGGWHTRTDANIQRSTSMYGSGRGRRGDDSSSDEETGNFVSVSNNRGQGTWSVDNVGKVDSRSPSRASNKRHSNLPVASGLIPAPTRAGMKRESSQSTITGINSRSGAATPTPGNLNGGPATLSRSNTLKSGVSVASAKSSGTAKTGGTAKKKTRPNGAISRSTSLTGQPAGEGRTIMSLVDASGPVMPDVPRAPKSQVTPQLELPKAPGSSLVPAASLTAPQANGTLPKSVSSPGQLTRSPSAKKVTPKDESPATARSTTPLPPSRTLAPPLKSALRPTSPTPSSPLAPPIDPPKPMFSISAPGPIELPQEEPAPIRMPAPAQKEGKTETENGMPPVNKSRNSYSSATAASDAGSVYESAVEDGGLDVGADESSGSEDEADLDKYQVVDNERVKRLGINVGPPSIERIPSSNRYAEEEHDEDDADGSVTSTDTATHASPRKGDAASILPHSPAQVPGTTSVTSDGVARRKSVRMAVPDSPGPNSPVDMKTPEANNKPLPSPEVKYEAQDWNTRIGRMREDTSEESDHDEGYLKARKGLLRNSGKWEAVSDGGKEKKSKRRSIAGSVKSVGSIGKKSSTKKQVAA